MQKFYFLLLLFLISTNILKAQMPEVRVLKPFVQIDKGLYHEAIDSISILLNSSQNIQLYFARINAYIHIGELDNAINDCYYIENQKNGNVSEYLAEIYLLKNDLNKAKKVLLDNLKSANKISLFQLLTDKKYRKIQDTEFMDSILKTGLFSATEKQIYKIEKYLSESNYPEAVFLANEVINRNPTIAEAYYLMSKINIQNSEFKQAKKNIDKAIDLKSGNLDYYFLRISINNSLQNYPEALLDVNKILRINPYLINAYLLKAELLLNNLDYNLAIQQADFYLNLYSKNPDALYIKANAFFRKDELLEALMSINESLETKKSIRQFELRGDIYLKTGTYKFAESDYSMALDLDARNGILWAKKGYSRYLDGNKTGACSDWEKGKRNGSIQSVEYLEKYCK